MSNDMQTKQKFVELEKRGFVDKQNIGDILAEYEKEFTAIVDDNGADFLREKKFAIQAFTNNLKLLDIVNNTTEGRISLQYALSNLASVGLTLNPLYQMCFLIPRKNKVVLDIGYRGFLDLGMKSGLIQMCICDIVKKGDEFIKNGLAEQPVHRFNPFDPERDTLNTIGAYCCTQLKNGLWKTDTMGMAELDKIKTSSPGSSHSSSAWQTWPGEMQKKSVLKRAAKMWGTPKDSKLAKAIAVDNETSGYTIDGTTQTVEGTGVNRAIDQLKNRAK